MITHNFVEGLASRIYESVLRQSRESAGCERPRVGPRTLPRDHEERSQRDLADPAALLHPCIEGWPQATYQQKWQEKLDRLDEFDPKREALATLLYSEAWMLETDREGRIMIPAELVAHANLKDAVTFMGRGDHFHIWEPAAGTQFRQASRAMAPGYAPKVTSA
jgi:MraZ protein